jgi:hypothetical protein
MSEVHFYKPEVQVPESIWIDRGPNGGWMFRTEKLHDSVRQYVPATRLAALEAAGKALYLAGKWELHDTDILPYEQAVMWGNLRDALGLPPVTATALTARGGTE